MRQEVDRGIVFEQERQHGPSDMTAVKIDVDEHCDDRAC
jgi:hypothetical protein